MKKTILTICALTGIMVGQAQEADSVSTSNNTSGVYYNLNSGASTAVAHNDWDLAFTTEGFDASILINEAKGAKLYVYSSDTTDWGSVDTAGFDFSFYYTNSTVSWQLGAFTAMAGGHPDYGWGTYNSGNHHLYGNKIFLLDNGQGYMCQIIIDELTVGGQWIFRTADIGGANSQTHTYTKSNFDEDNFFLFNVQSGQESDAEPKSDEWHLLFTKYYAEVQGQYYPVSGVKINGGLQVAERPGVAVENDDTVGLVWSSSITEIGYDWKTFNMQTFSYEITPELTYFVRNNMGDVWKIYFTSYSMGKYVFNVEKLSSNASVREFSPFKANLYPNPVRSQLFLENGEGEDARIRILTMNGQLVEEHAVNAMTTATVDVSGLNPGLYLVEVQGDHKMSTYRIAVQ